MAKNQINFTKMSETASKQLQSFKDSALMFAKEDLRYKAEKKKLDDKLATILANRKIDLDNGISVDEVTAKYSRVEVDGQLVKLLEDHNAILEPIKKAMSDTYDFIPNNMYAAYEKKISEHKRGDFLNAIKNFLENLGITGCTSAQISTFAENMSDMFGAKYATSKKIVDEGSMVMALKKQQFNKLFMAVFCEMYIK